MVDVIQVPVYTESIFIYIVLSALIFGFIALAIFILVFFRRDYKEMILKTAKVEARVGNLDKSLQGAENIDKRFRDIEKQVKTEMQEIEEKEREIEQKTRDVDKKMKVIGLETRHYAKSLDRKMDHDLNTIRRFVVSKMHGENKSLKSAISRETKEMDEDIEEMKSEIKKLQKDVKKRYKNMSMFFLYRIFEDLSSETEEEKIEKKLDDLRLFVKFSKKNKYWNSSIEKTVSDFLRNMEKRWRSESKNISTMYSMSLEELR